MQRIAVLLLIALFFAACAGETPEGEQYGEALTLSSTTNISDILDNPESFLGKTVLIEGTALAVCQHRGCWIDLAGDEPYQKVRVKVEDGVIVFPMTAKGKSVRAEGEVYKIEMTEEEAIAYFAHMAEMAGEPFDSTSVTGPHTIYQIKGTGAVVSM